MSQLNKSQLDSFKSISASRDGQNLLQYIKELILVCESAKGKKDMEEVHGGLIAGKILQEELVDKLESLSGNTTTKEVDEDQFT